MSITTCVHAAVLTWLRVFFTTNAMQECFQSLTGQVTLFWNEQNHHHQMKDVCRFLFKFNQKQRTASKRASRRAASNCSFTRAALIRAASSAAGPCLPDCFRSQNDDFYFLLFALNKHLLLCHISLQRSKAWTKTTRTIWIEKQRGRALHSAETCSTVGERMQCRQRTTLNMKC